MRLCTGTGTTGHRITISLTDESSLTTVDAKYLDAGEGCDNADAKAERVRERGDGDGDGCVFKRMPHPLGYGEQWRGAPPSSDHDKCVVDPDS